MPFDPIGGTGRLTMPDPAGGILEVSLGPEGVRRERSYPPQILRCRGPMRLRRDLDHPVDQAGTAPGNLLELPSVLHRTAKAARYGRPHRALYEEVRRPDVG